MTFLAPLGLLALLTLPIILLLHLRRERLRRVAVPSIILWQHLAPAAGKQRKRMLPITWLLVLHLLIAALISFALGQPEWLGQLLGQGQQHLIVIVDTSTSMAAQENSSTTRLDQARDQIGALLTNMGSDDQLSLIAVDSHARLLTTGNYDNSADVVTVLGDLEAMGTGTALDEALTIAQVAQESSRTSNNRVVIISDLEAPEDAGFPADRFEWIRVGRNTENQAIVTLAAHPQRGTTGYDVYARVVNYGDLSVLTTLNLFADDELLNTRSVDLQAGGEAELTWSLPAGIEVLRAELDTKDALAVDNIARLSLTQSRSVRVLLVSEENEALNRVLDIIPDLDVTTVSPAEYPTSPLAASADLTIFNAALPTEYPEGSVLLINPPPVENAFFSIEAAPVAAEPADDTLPAIPPHIEITLPNGTQSMLAGLSLGSVDFGPLPRIEPPPWAEVEALADDVPVILRGRTGDSEIAVWAFDLAQGNLTSKLAFPLLTARTIRHLMTPSPPASLLVGQALTFQPSSRTDTIEVRSPDDQTRQLPAARSVSIDGFFRQPGLYNLLEQAGNDLVYEGTIAVNAGTPLESDLRSRPLPLTESPYVATQRPSAASGESTVQENSEAIWPWFAMAALLTMLIEWLYVHWR